MALSRISAATYRPPIHGTPIGHFLGGSHVTCPNHRHGEGYTEKRTVPSENTVGPVASIPSGDTGTATVPLADAKLESSAFLQRQ
jgi:hypothetical protein